MAKRTLYSLILYASRLSGLMKKPELHEDGLNESEYKSLSQKLRQNDISETSVTDDVPDCDYIIVISPEKTRKNPHITEELLNQIADLIVSFCETQDHDIALFLKPSTLFLYREAENIKMYKRLVNGGQAEFHQSDIDIYRDAILEGGHKNPDFFTSSERITIIDAYLTTRKLTTAPYVDKPLLMQCQRLGFVTHAFPPQDAPVRKKLMHDWVKGRLNFYNQPLDQIRAYLGERIAFYAAFLGYYTWLLLFPSLVGVGMWLQQQREGDLDSVYMPFYSIFICLWAVIMLEMFRRHSNSLAHIWGSHGSIENEIERPAYYGEMQVNVITGEKERMYSSSVRLAKQAVVWCTIGAVLGIIMWIMVKLMRYDKEWIGRHWIISMLPNIGQAIVVEVSNRLFVMLASVLNDWENWKTQSEHDNHKVLKLVLFYAINTYTPLFFLAFYERRLTSLKEQLLSLLLIHQLLDNFQEAAWPWIRVKLMRYVVWWLQGVAKEMGEDVEHTEKPEKLSILQEQIELDDYNDTFEDYLELVIQFGHVTFFAAAFPLAALLALANNIIEIRSDAFKILNCKRPVPRRCEGIGSWFLVLQGFSVIAVMTNTALICASTDQLSVWLGDYEDTQSVAIAIAIEHIVMGIAMFIGYIVPDKPRWVRIELAKEEYKGRMLLEEQRRQLRNK